LILYNSSYADFCKKLCGGFIDRDDPREDFNASFERYKATLKTVKSRSELIKPFKNLWPEYKDVNEFKTDYEHTSYISAEHLPTLVDFMNEHCVHATTDQIHVQTCSNLAKEARINFCINKEQQALGVSATSKPLTHIFASAEAK
jgi:hypothetical protein